MAKLNWKAEAARLRKISKDLEAIRDRMWDSDSVDTSWDRPLAEIAERIDNMADQIECIAHQSEDDSFGDERVDQ